MPKHSLKAINDDLMGPFLPRLHSLEWLDEALAVFRELLHRAENLDTQAELYPFRYGLCNAVMQLSSVTPMKPVFAQMGSPYPLVTAFAAFWPHTVSPRKDDCYPVPHDCSYGYWEGPNLTMRLSLIRYCIKRLRDYRRRALKRREHSNA